MNEYAQFTPREIMLLIDNKFEEYAGTIKRTDIKWGVWSREINLEIRERIERKDPDAVILGMIYSYWMTLSQLLDLVYDYKGLKRFLLEKKIKNKTNEAITIRDRIYEGS